MRAADFEPFFKNHAKNTIFGVLKKDLWTNVQVKQPHHANVVYKRAGKLIRNQLRFKMEFQAGWVVS